MALARSMRQLHISPLRYWADDIGNVVGTFQRLSNRTAHSVFGEIDAEKLHASLTLFSEASGDEFLLESMFDVWFDGLLHEETMIALSVMSGQTDLSTVSVTR